MSFVWPNQPSLPPALPLGYVTPAGTDVPPTSLTLWTSQQIEALRIKFQESLMQLVVLAVQGFLTAGQTAFTQLQNWATLIENAANGAADDIASMLDGLLGTGHTITDFVNYLQDVGSDASAAIANWLTVFTNTGQSTAALLSSFISDAYDNAADSIANFGTILSATGYATVSALASALANLFGFLTSIPANLISGVTTAQQQLQDTLNQVFNPIADAGADLAALATSAQNSLQGLLPAVVDNLDGTYTALAGLVDNHDGTFSYTPGANPVQTLIDQADGTWATVSEAFHQAATAATAVAGNTMTAAANAGQQAWNMLVGAFGLGVGAAVPASTPAQAEQAVVNTQASLAANAAGLAALNALLTQTQNGGGTSVSISFSDYADGAMPAAFTTPISTFPDTLTIGSGKATDASGDGGGASYNATTTVGDNQLVAGVFTSVSGTASVGGLGYSVSLIGRQNAGSDTYVSADYVASFGAWALRTVVSGSVTFLRVFAFDTFTPGAVYALACGTGAVGNRVFQILKNGAALTLTDADTFSDIGTSYTDSANITQMGASYRRGGLALASSAKISTWTLVDSAPPSVIGSGFRAYRSSNTTINSSSGSPSLLGNSFYDTIAQDSADMTYVSGTANKLTVSVSGWYIVELVFWSSAYFNGGSSANFAPVVYKNGSVYSIGEPLVFGYAAAHTFNVYLAAGDYIQPGYQSNGANNGVLGGASTLYWSAMLANCGTLS